MYLALYIILYESFITLLSYEYNIMKRWCTIN